jgi:hypothetical protein
MIQVIEFRPDLYITKMYKDANKHKNIFKHKIPKENRQDNLGRMRGKFASAFRMKWL